MATAKAAPQLRFFYHRKRGVWSVWLLAVILLSSCGREANQTDKAAVTKEDMNQGDGIGEVKEVNGNVSLMAPESMKPSKVLWIGKL